MKFGLKRLKEKFDQVTKLFSACDLEDVDDLKKYKTRDQILDDFLNKHTGMGVGVVGTFLLTLGIINYYSGLDQEILKKQSDKLIAHRSHEIEEQGVQGEDDDLLPLSNKEAEELVIATFKEMNEKFIMFSSIIAALGWFSAPFYLKLGRDAEQIYRKESLEIEETLAYSRACGAVIDARIKELDQQRLSGPNPA